MPPINGAGVTIESSLASVRSWTMGARFCCCGGSGSLVFSGVKTPRSKEGFVTCRSASDCSVKIKNRVQTSTLALQKKVQIFKKMPAR
jgi:hypothetical protein